MRKCFLAICLVISSGVNASAEGMLQKPIMGGPVTVRSMTEKERVEVENLVFRKVKSVLYAAQKGGAKWTVLLTRGKGAMRKIRTCERPVFTIGIIQIRGGMVALYGSINKEALSNEYVATVKRCKGVRLYASITTVPDDIQNASASVYNAFKLLLVRTMLTSPAAQGYELAAAFLMERVANSLRYDSSFLERAMMNRVAISNVTKERLMRQIRSSVMAKVRFQVARNRVGRLGYQKKDPRLQLRAQKRLQQAFLDWMYSIKTEIGMLMNLKKNNPEQAAFIRGKWYLEAFRHKALFSKDTKLDWRWGAVHGNTRSLKTRRQDNKESGNNLLPVLFAVLAMLGMALVLFGRHVRKK